MTAESMFPPGVSVGVVGWFHLVYFGVALPVANRVDARKVVRGTGPLPNRLRNFQVRSLVLALLALISLGVAWVQRIPLFPRALPTVFAVLAGGALYLFAVAFMRPRWRRAAEAKFRALHFSAPATPGERGWWIVVSVLAGVGEEITWRGVQVALLAGLTGSHAIAAVASAVLFGLVHGAESPRGMLYVAVFGLGFQALVVLAGSLYVAMAVHATYDVTAGIAHGRLLGEMAARAAPPSEGPAS